MTKDSKTQLLTPAKRTLVRQPLDTIGGIIAEAAKVYREARDGKTDHEKARSLVWMLGQLRAMVEIRALAEIEDRLDALIGAHRHGHESADGQASRPH